MDIRERRVVGTRVLLYKARDIWEWGREVLVRIEFLCNKGFVLIFEKAASGSESSVNNCTVISDEGLLYSVN